VLCYVTGDQDSNGAGTIKEVKEGGGWVWVLVRVGVPATLHTLPTFLHYAFFWLMSGLPSLRCSTLLCLRTLDTAL
jgi:hypothetical protein